MAIIWADGFDHYGVKANLPGNIYSGSYFLSVNPADPRTGTGCIYLTGGPGEIDVQQPGLTAGIISFALKLAGVEDSFFIAGVAPAGPGGFPFQLTAQADGSILVYSGASVIGQTPPQALVVNVWMRMEIGYNIIGDATGFLEIRINEQTVLRLDGPNIDPDYGTVTILRVKQYYHDAWLDDLVFQDGNGINNSWLGDVRCRTVFATANGANQDWQANGDPLAYNDINSVPPDVTKYISSNDAGDISNFSYAPLPANTAAVFGVVAFANGSKSDAGACTMKFGVVSGGSLGLSADIAVGQGGSFYSTVLNSDPNGNVQWTPNAANNIKSIVERTT